MFTINLALFDDLPPAINLNPTTRHAKDIRFEMILPGMIGTFAKGACVACAFYDRDRVHSDQFEAEIAEGVAAAQRHLDQTLERKRGAR